MVQENISRWKKIDLYNDVLKLMHDNYLIYLVSNESCPALIGWQDAVSNLVVLPIPS